jgi:hypothetical protein
MTRLSKQQRMVLTFLSNQGGFASSRAPELTRLRGGFLKTMYALRDKGLVTLLPLSPGWKLTPAGKAAVWEVPKQPEAAPCPASTPT